MGSHVLCPDSMASGAQDGGWPSRAAPGVSAGPGLEQDGGFVSCFPFVCWFTKLERRWCTILAASPRCGVHIWWVWTHVSTLGSDGNKPVTICPCRKGRYEPGAVPVFLVSVGPFTYTCPPLTALTALPLDGSRDLCVPVLVGWVLDSTRK